MIRPGQTGADQDKRRRRAGYPSQIVILTLSVACMEAQKLTVVAARSDSIEFFGPNLSQHFSLPATAYDVKHHPAGTLAAVSRPVDQSIDFYDLTAIPPVASFPSIESPARTLAFTADGSCLVATTPTGVASFVVSTRSAASDISTRFPVTAVAAAAPDLILVGDGARKQLVGYWIDPATCKLREAGQATAISGATTNDPVQIVVSPNGREIVGVNRTAGLDVFRRSGALLERVTVVGYPKGVTGYSAAYLPDASRLYVHAATAIWVLETSGSEWKGSGVRIPVPGGRPLGAVGTKQIVSDGSHLYFTAKDSIGVASVSTNRLTRTVPAGTSPVSMDVSGQLRVKEERTR